YGDFFIYDMNSTDPELIEWMIDSVADTQFEIDNYGVLTNDSILYVGEYPVHVWGWNIYGYRLDIFILVNVTDTIGPVWVEEPEDVFLEYSVGSFASYFYAYDLSYVNRWWLNDTTNFNLNIQMGTEYGWTCQVVSVSLLSIGVYGLDLRAYDPYNNSLSATFSIIVRDTIPPELDISPEDFSMEEGAFGSGEPGDLFDISWAFIDYGPSSYEILLDGTQIESGEWDSGIIIELSIAINSLSPGTYNYTIIVTDIGGNTASDTWFLTITPGPTTSPTPTVEPPDMALILALGVIGLAAIVVIIIVMKKR
ncbi:MAG: hypothetical protein ACFE7R_09585, partial [Candidatus Hodarchaeota archaeon]